MLRTLILHFCSQVDGNYAFLLRLHDSYRNASPPDIALIDCLHQIVRAFKDIYYLRRSRRELEG